MQLAHTGDDGLTCFLICMSTECRVFFSQFCKSFTHLLLSGFCLRLNCQLDNWLWEFHRLQNNRMLFITDGITCTCYFETNSCCNITGVNFIKLCSLVCMHLQDTSYTFFLVFRSVQYIRTGVHCTGVNTEECQFTYERVSHDLECQSCERFVIGRMSFNFVSIQVCTFDCRNIQRRWHELYDSIQKFLDTFISVSCTTANRNCFTTACSFS